MIDRSSRGGQIWFPQHLLRTFYIITGELSVSPTKFILKIHLSDSMSEVWRVILSDCRPMYAVEKFIKDNQFSYSSLY